MSMSKEPQAEPSSYNVIAHPDENGDLMLPIPPDMLKKLKWKQDDEILIRLDADGNYILSRKKK